MENFSEKWIPTKHLLQKNIQKFVNNMFNQRPQIATVSKKELTDYFTVFRLLSDIVQIRLIKAMINA